MSKRWMLIGVAGCALAACATASFEGTPIAEWAGAYGKPQPPPPVDNGEHDDDPSWDPSWNGENAIEIRPAGPTRARIDVVLFFPRGHQCSLSGPAELVNGKLIYRETNEYGACQISVSREKNRAGEDELVIREDSEPKACMMVHCGARGYFGTGIAVSTRHALPATPLGELEE